MKSACETNKRKQKRDDDDDFDYLYGIVTTGRDWHFLLYRALEKYPRQVTLRIRSNLPRRPWIQTQKNTSHCVRV